MGSSCISSYKTYSIRMSTCTLTIRLPKEQRETLRRAAGALRKSESEYMRELLARDLEAASFRERAGDLAGCLHSSRSAGRSAHPLKVRIKSANWRE